jgi:hypothetical protein
LPSAGVAPRSFTGHSVSIAASVIIAVTIIVVVMPAVSRHAPIGDPDLERTFQTEADDRVPRNPHRSTADLAATDGSNDCTNEAVVAARFDTVGICLDGIAHAVRHNRFKVEDQVVIASKSDE